MGILSVSEWSFDCGVGLLFFLCVERASAKIEDDDEWDEDSHVGRLDYKEGHGRSGLINNPLLRMLSRVALLLPTEVSFTSDVYFWKCFFGGNLTRN